MLTLFSIPKPFGRSTDIIQHNAITSWLHLKPRPQVILFGNDKSVAETAAHMGVEYISEIECNQFGTPLLSSAFDTAQRLAQYRTVCYSNADIIFTSDFTRAIQRIGLSKFLLVGRRTDTPITTVIDFEHSDWEGQLLAIVANQGLLHSYSGIDYFVFPRGQIQLLPFPVGRVLWDNWLIFHCRTLGIPVIDATRCVTAIHQNHDYAHLSEGIKTARAGAEVQQNWRMVGADFYPFNIQDATLLLTTQGLQKNYGLSFLWRGLMTLPARYQRLRPLIRMARKLKRAYRRLA